MNDPDPRIAIVLATYKQGSFAAEAIASALNQVDPAPYRIIAVNDGCPFPETAAILDGLARQNANVDVLHQQNGGLSAARNHGVRFALGRYPSLEAVFFLDSDNLLDPHALKLLGTLLDQHKNGDWFYPNFDMFGVEGNFHNTGEFSVARLAETNYCEAGSLVRCDLFRAGVWFDETMRQGYEDWDFWLQACQKGFRGRPIEQSFFRYRKRAGSMLSDSHGIDAKLRHDLTTKHRWLYGGDRVLRAALAEGALINVIGPQSGYKVDGSGNFQPVAIEDLLAELTEYVIDPNLVRSVPYWLIASSGALKFLGGPEYSAGVFNHMITALDTSPVSTARFVSSQSNALTLTLDAPKWHNRTAIWDGSISTVPNRDYSVTWILNQLTDAEIVMTSTKHMALLVENSGLEAALAAFTKELLPLELRVGMPDLQPSGENMGQKLVDLADQLQRSTYANDDLAAFQGWRAPPDVMGPDQLPEILARNQCGGAPYLFPRNPDRLQVGFVLPILQFGGVEKCAIALATAMQEHDVDCHLFVYGNQECTATSWLREPFSTVHILDHPGLRSWNGPQYLGSKLADRPHDELMARILGPLCGMDAVIQSGCGVLHHGAAQLREKGVVCFSWEHLLETEFYGRNYGTPYQFLAFEAVYDMVLTCSKSLAGWMVAQGVPSSKVLAVPNGPGFPGTSTPRRPRPANAPLRVGFLGRTDLQKGVDRFVEIATQCRDQFEFHLMGKHIIDGRDVIAMPDFIIQHETAYEVEELEQAYARMDILLMPSRVEGLPLSIYEAQRAGVVPICTNVGAVSEAIIDGVSGYIIDPDNVVGQVVDTLRMLNSDRAEFHRVSDMAVSEVDPWAENAANVLNAIKALK